jgi:hypothetical protein
MGQGFVVDGDPMAFQCCNRAFQIDRVPKDDGSDD